MLWRRQGVADGGKRMDSPSIYKIKTDVFQAAQRLVATKYRRLFSASLETKALEVIASFELPDDVWLQIDYTKQEDLKYCKHGWTTDFDHLVGVSLLAIRYAIQQKYSDLEVQKHGLIGLLHDIIKPTNLTHKDRHLTLEERALMDKHPVESLEFLKKKWDVDSYVEDAVGGHHKWIKLNPDSQFRSYPDDGMPPGFAAKLYAALDMVDAVARGRSFRVREEFKDGSVTRAISELVRESDENNPDGIHYDKKIVTQLVPGLERAI